MKNYRHTANSGPFGKLLALLVSVIVLIAGVMFSMLMLAVIAVAGLAAWGFFWWKTRKLRGAMRDQPPGGLVIDGEAVVVEDGESRQEKT
ncbi:MAG: hypothetical protein WCV99_16220 [Sterolibacterium sp.]|jgi:hypothetical protein